MNKKPKTIQTLSSFALLGIFILYGCAPTPMPTATVTITQTATKTLTPTPTRTSTSVPTITLTPSITPLPTLEAIKGGWSTFENKEFGFKFQYPAVYEKGFETTFSTCDVYTEPGENSLYILIGEIMIDVEKTQKSLVDYTKDYLDEIASDWDGIDQENIETPNLIATHLEYYRKNPGRSGMSTILVGGSSAAVIQTREVNFSNCGISEYSSFWVHDRIVETFVFQEN